MSSSPSTASGGFQRHPLFPYLTLLRWVVPLVLMQSPGQSLMAHDEGIYAIQAKSIVETGDWITPQWAEGISFDRTIGIQWLIALGYQLFGISEAVVRLPSQVAFVASVLLLYRIAEIVLQRRSIAWLSAAILTYIPQVGNFPKNSADSSFRDFSGKYDSGPSGSRGNLPRGMESISGMAQSDQSTSFVRVVATASLSGLSWLLGLLDLGLTMLGIFGLTDRFPKLPGIEREEVIRVAWLLLSLGFGWLALLLTWLNRQRQWIFRSAKQWLVCLILPVWLVLGLTGCRRIAGI